MNKIISKSFQSKSRWKPNPTKVPKATRRTNLLPAAAATADAFLPRPPNALVDLRLSTTTATLQPANAVVKTSAPPTAAEEEEEALMKSPLPHLIKRGNWKRSLRIEIGIGSPSRACLRPPEDRANRVPPRRCCRRIKGRQGARGYYSPHLL